MDPINQQLMMMAGSQSPTGYWITEFTGSGTTNMQGLAYASSGSIYVVADRSLYPELLKLDTNGSLAWLRRFGSASQNNGGKVALDTSENIYFGGYNFGTVEASTFASFLVKYNSSGTIQFQRSLNATPTITDVCQGTAVDSTGNIYIAGYINTSTQYGYVAKYNSAGTIQWQRWLGAGRFYGNIAVDSSANIYCWGVVNNTQDGPLFTKWNTSGTLQWQRRFGTVTGSESVGGIAVNSAGDIYVAGSTKTIRNPSTDILLYKYDTAGTLQWQRALTGVSANNSGAGVSLDTTGNPVMACAYEGGTLVAKYDSTGALQWQRLLTLSGDTLSPSVMALGGADEIAIAGNLSGSRIWVCKLRADGSGLGTFGNYTYAAGTATASTPAITGSTPTLTSSTSSMTAATSTLTDQAGAYSQTALNIA